MELLLLCYHGKTNRETKFNNASLGSNQTGEVKFVLYLKQFQCESNILLFHGHKQNKNSSTKQVQNCYLFFRWLN